MSREFALVRRGEWQAGANHESTTGRKHEIGRGVVRGDRIVSAFVFSYFRDFVIFSVMQDTHVLAGCQAGNDGSHGVHGRLESLPHH
jgi:hypothetical protein